MDVYCVSKHQLLTCPCITAARADDWLLVSPLAPGRAPRCAGHHLVITASPVPGDLCFHQQPINTPGAQCAKLIANASATFMLTKNVERM